MISIRGAIQNDVDDIASIEATCFPSAEAASRSAFEERLSVYPEGCFVAEKNNQIIGFINGAATDSLILEDEFYASMDLHNPKGKNLVIFGLDVLPNYQNQGYARELMNRYIEFGRKEKKSAILLTCKERLVA